MLGLQFTPPALATSAARRRGGAAAAWPLAVRAQQPVRCIGVLMPPQNCSGLKSRRSCVVIPLET
jgi:hypothetical protein